MDGQTDARTEFLSLDRICIPNSQHVFIAVYNSEGFLSLFINCFYRAAWNAVR